VLVYLTGQQDNGKPTRSFNNMIIENAIYLADDEDTDVRVIKCTINGKDCFVPCVSKNRDYAEIMRQVEAGELTIAEAE